MGLEDSVRIRLAMCKYKIGRNLECVHWGLCIRSLCSQLNKKKAQLAKRLTRSPLSVQLSGLKSPANHCQRPTLGGMGIYEQMVKDPGSIPGLRIPFFPFFLFAS